MADMYQQYEDGQLDRDEVAQALKRTWDIIAYDCFVNEDGEPDLSIILDRDTVIELALDRLDMFHPKAARCWHTLADEEREDILEKAFPNIIAVYGY